MHRLVMKHLTRMVGVPPAVASMTRTSHPTLHTSSTVQRMDDFYSSYTINSTTKTNGNRNPVEWTQHTNQRALYKQWVRGVHQQTTPDKDQRCPQNKPQPSLESATHLPERGMILTSWIDGPELLYPCVWLRDGCPCPDCWHPVSKARQLRMVDVQLDVQPAELKVSLCKPFQDY